MDRIIEYDPRIGTKLAYMVNAGARGLCEGAEDGIDYLKVSGIGMAAHDTRKKYKKAKDSSLAFYLKFFTGTNE